MAYEYATTLYIKVTADDIDDIEYTQDITGITASFSVTLTIPNGDDRTFYVELKDLDGLQDYLLSLLLYICKFEGKLLCLNCLRGIVGLLLHPQK